MKKNILLIAILFICLVNFAQTDSTSITFVNDTIFNKVTLDSTECSEFNVMGNIGHSIYRNENTAWFVYDTVIINQFKYIVKQVQFRYLKDGTKLRRIQKDLYVITPVYIRKKLIYN